MTSQDWITHTAQHIRQQFAGDSSGHDWWHVHRVWRMAERLAAAEGADTVTVQLAALLHDIADWKFHDGDLTIGPERARAWLQDLHVPEPIVTHVAQIVAGVSYKGANVATPMSTLEGACVQDADRLDAIGAIGIARAFAYGGHAGRLMYDPEIPPEAHDTPEAYRTRSGPTINHFYEKLLLLKDRLQTRTARDIAAPRHAFMEQFLHQFFTEWTSQDGASLEIV